MDLDENKIFKEYHEKRLRRRKAEIEAGLICPEEDDVELYLEGLTGEQVAEMKAKSELKEYEEAIKKRQEKFAMKDVAQMIVENKVLVDRVDAALNQAPTGDIGTSYDEIGQSKLNFAEMDSLAISQSLIGASITLTGRGGTSRMVRAEDIEDMDELPDSLVDKMYNDLVGDSVATSSEPSEREKKPKAAPKNAGKSKKRKIAPATASLSQSSSVRFAPSITSVGKKAKSRLFDYESDQHSNKEYLAKQEAKHEQLKQMSVQELRTAAAEKKKALKDHLRESLSRERVATLKSQSMADRSAAVHQIKAEHRMRQEIQNVNKSMMNAMSLAFKD